MGFYIKDTKYGSQIENIGHSYILATVYIHGISSCKCSSFDDKLWRHY